MFDGDLNWRAVPDIFDPESCDLTQYEFYSPIVMRNMSFIRQLAFSGGI
jgi:hypothetical protein